MLQKFENNFDKQQNDFSVIKQIQMVKLVIDLKELQEKKYARFPCKSIN